MNTEIHNKTAHWHCEHDMYKKNNIEKSCAFYKLSFFNSYCFSASFYNYYSVICSLHQQASRLHSDIIYLPWNIKVWVWSPNSCMQASVFFNLILRFYAVPILKLLRWKKTPCSIEYGLWLWDPISRSAFWRIDSKEKKLRLDQSRGNSLNQHNQTMILWTIVRWPVMVNNYTHIIIHSELIH